MAQTKKIDFNQFGDTLPKEDRLYGGNTFYIDLIPSSSWFQNLRTIIAPSQWKALSAYVRARNNDQCEICTSGVKLEAHERWSFDEISKTQKLERIMCLCKMCHLSVHSGLAGIIGLGAEVEDHISKITGWSKNEQREQKEAARNKWLLLSKTTWRFDLSILDDVGVEFISEEMKREKIAQKKKSIRDAEKIRPLWVDIIYNLFNDPVVFYPVGFEDYHGAYPLPTKNHDDEYVEYSARSNNDVDIGRPRLSINNFIKAGNNLIVVDTEEEMQNIIANHKTPSMLEVNRDWIPVKIIDDCLGIGIIFSVRKIKKLRRNNKGIL